MDLHIKHLHAGYSGVPVLRDVSFDLPSGSIIGVLGRNGMGKTTLIRCLSGLISPSSGEILLGETDVTRLPAYKRAQLGITTVVQGRGVFPQLTVEENLRFGQMASGRAKQSRLEEVLSYFPILDKRMKQAAGTMSGGEQQMLAIGRGIMTNPTIMLLDEPSDGIMPKLVAEITDILITINKREKLSMVVVEQNVPMVFKMASQCLILEKGRVWWQRVACMNCQSLR